MSSRARSLLFQIGSFALAGVLLYLALRGVDLRSVGRALAGADYVWLIPLVVVIIGSHVLRAWRWQVFIEVLPEATPWPGERASFGSETMRSAAPETGRSATATERTLPPQAAHRSVPSFKQAFYSVMIGYMVNYAAPRLGEIARTANLSAQSRLSFSSLFGTVVVERILDVAVLLAAIGSVFILLIDRASTLDRLFIEPMMEQVGRVPTVAVGIATAALFLVAGYLFRQALRRQDSIAFRFWSERARPAVVSFRDGLASLLHVRRWGILAGSTAAMWVLYLLAAYLPFLMLGMADTYQIGLLDTWSIMILGAVGVAIPSPGGTGSYHYITVQTLVHLFGFSHEAAATYAVLTHGAQLVLYVLTGAVCLTLQGSSFRTLKRRTVAAQEEKHV